MEAVGTTPIVLALFTLVGLILGAWRLVLSIEEHKREKRTEKVKQRELARPVIDAVEEFIRGVCQEGGFSEEELDDYWQAVHNDLLLFNKKRRSLLKEVYKKATELRFAKSQKESHKNDENDDKYQIFVKEEHELLSWFSERFGKIQEDFRDYLEVK